MCFSNHQGASSSIHHAMQASPPNQFVPARRGRPPKAAVANITENVAAKIQAPQQRRSSADQLFTMRRVAEMKRYAEERANLRCIDTSGSSSTKDMPNLASPAAIDPAVNRLTPEQEVPNVEQQQNTTRTEESAGSGIQISIPENSQNTASGADVDRLINACLADPADFIDLDELDEADLEHVFDGKKEMKLEVDEQAVSIYLSLVWIIGEKLFFTVGPAWKLPLVGSMYTCFSSQIHS